MRQMKKRSAVLTMRETSGEPLIESLATLKSGSRTYEHMWPIYNGTAAKVYTSVTYFSAFNIVFHIKSRIIKMLKKEFMDNEKEKRQFEHGTELHARLKHRNIVRIREQGVIIEPDGYGGLPYHVMEYLNGETLDKIIRKHQELDNEDTTLVGLEICRAMAYAHKRGIVHRDIKPENVMIVPGKRSAIIKLLDFGIAKMVGEKDAWDKVEGTPIYMSFEQASASTIMESMDIYCLGVTMFEMLTGRVPYMADADETANEYLMRVWSTELPIPRVSDFNNKVDRKLDDIVWKCMQRYPDQRYWNMDHLACALRG